MQACANHVGGEYVCDEGVARMVADKGHDAVIVASEPLSPDPGWRAVPENHMVLVREDLQVEQRPIEV
ncbi:MAG: class II glutamine amidotransferase [Planctomycetota bacterium]|jgi:predicted glutamine amidotransferase